MHSKIRNGFMFSIFKPIPEKLEFLVVFLQVRLICYLIISLFVGLLFTAQSVMAQKFLPDIVYVGNYHGVKEVNLSTKKITNRSLSEIKDWQLFKDPNNRSSTFFGEPTGSWITENNFNIGNIQRIINDSDDKVPVLVLYFLKSNPAKLNNKDLEDSISSEYLQKNNEIARAIGDKKVIVILEPDTLPLSSENGKLLQFNQEVLYETVKLYRTMCPSTRVYIDAGHSNWHNPVKMHYLLKYAGINLAHGFATNISNFQPTDKEKKYATELSKLLGNKRFIIDTSRNGNGTGIPRPNCPAWSDPLGISTGIQPTTITDINGLDAYLWIKPPGEADGSAAPAGSWHPDLISKS